jgi:flagellar basal-body rod modification protein FlgD
MQLLVDNQAALQSVGLLGRTVEVLSDGSRTTGTVTAMSLQGDAPLLTLSLPGGAVMNDVALSRIVAIR